MKWKVTFRGTQSDAREKPRRHRVTPLLTVCGTFWVQTGSTLSLFRSAQMFCFEYHFIHKHESAFSCQRGVTRRDESGAPINPMFPVLALQGHFALLVFDLWIINCFICCREITPRSLRTEFARLNTIWTQGSYCRVQCSRQVTADVFNISAEVAVTANAEAHFKETYIFCWYLRLQAAWNCSLLNLKPWFALSAHECEVKQHHFC